MGYTEGRKVRWEPNTQALYLILVFMSNYNSTILYLYEIFIYFSSSITCNIVSIPNRIHFLESE